MPQKKLQLKTVAANMCGLQPGNSGLIQFVKQQSQSIAVSYTLALALFLFVGLFSDWFSIQDPILHLTIQAKGHHLAFCFRVKCSFSISVI